MTAGPVRDAEDVACLATSSPRHLPGKTIGVEARAAHEAYLEAFFANAPIRPYETGRACARRLRSGAVETLFGDGARTELLAQRDRCGRLLRFQRRRLPRYQFLRRRRRHRGAEKQLAICAACSTTPLIRTRRARRLCRPLSEVFPDRALLEFRGISPSFRGGLMSGVRSRRKGRTNRLACP